MSDDNKVVPFPAHRVKNNKTQENEPAVSPVGPMSMNRRVTLAMSLLSTVLVATFLASQMNRKSENLQQTADRVLASAGETIDLQEEVQLAKKIARDSLRQPASRGHEPTPEEVLRHGPDLASVYALRFDDKGALLELRYQGPAGKKRELRDRQRFIKENADIFKIHFDTVVREPNVDLAASRGAGSERFEVYNLKDGDKTKATIHFTLDQDNKVSQMNVEPR